MNKISTDGKIYRYNTKLIKKCDSGWLQTEIKLSEEEISTQLLLLQDWCSKIRETMDLSLKELEKQQNEAISVMKEYIDNKIKEVQNGEKK